MDGHVVRVVHGYGYEPIITLDKMTLKNVKSYTISGEVGKLPKITVTLTATSVVVEETSTEEQEVK